MNDKAILELFYNGRCYNKLFILSSQFPMTFEQDLRSNFDYIFLFHNNFNMGQKKLYDHYGGMFPTFDVFAIN